MTPKPSARRPLYALSLPLALLLVVLPAVRPAAASELGAATPQELVQRLAAAAEAEDFGELAACVAPDDRAALTMMMLLGAGMMAAFAQMGAGLAEGMAEGLAEAFAEEGGEAAAEAAEPPSAEEAAAEAAAAAERAAMAERAAAAVARYEEILERHGVEKLMDENPDPGSPEAAAELLAEVDQPALIADLFDLMKNAFPGEGGGDAMPIAITTTELSDLVVEGDRAHGRVGDEEVDMVRVDGRWYLDIPTDADAAGEDTDTGEDG